MKKTLLFMALALTGLSANIANAQTTIASGDCGASGNNLTWVLTSDSVLTISGSGAMADYDWGDAPWFSNSMAIKTLVIGNSVTTIGDRAFSGCSNLISVTLGNSVTTIGRMAFGGCELSGTLTIPSSVTTIGIGAFSYCIGLTGELTIPNSVTAIGYAAFSGCSGLTSINVAANNPNYSSNDGILYNKVQDTLICYPAGKTGVLTIPNSVTTIGIEAFIGCSELTSITLGNSVTTIGNGAFLDCHELTDITSLAINPPATGVNVFYNVSKTIPVHVPCGSENAYKVAYGWREFTNYTDCIGGNGLTDIEAANFNIYPNPANDRINFSCLEMIKEIEVFNIVGQQVYVAKVNEKFTALNVAGFAKGSYIAKLHTTKGILEKKFVVE